VTNASLAKERSYHIFYQILKGSQKPGNGCAALLGRQPTEFTYTSLSGTNWVDAINDDKDFEEMDAAMPSCGLAEADKLDCYNVLGSLLFIGNVTFGQDGDNIAVKPETMKDLREAEKLLGIGQIDGLLIEKVVKSPRSNNQYHIALDMGAAQSQRDALVKHLYHMLFNLLIEKINSQIQVEKDFHRFIGLLDVFGFEVFQTNSFEQLCINYANERLHNFFLMRVFEVEIELYRMQQLQVPVLTYPDNSKVIELLEKSPTGIFPLLDSQCKMPKGSDKNFNGAICKQHANHPHFSTLSASKMKMSGVSDDDVFVIHHFAGDVCYSSDKFLEKNTDSLSAQFETVLLKSTRPIVGEMITGLKKAGKGDSKGDQSARSKGLEPGQMSARGQAGGSTNRGGKGGDQKAKSGSVSKMFLLGLKQLMREIATTHPFFIRCIKPNQKLVPIEFHTSMVLSQMERSGTIECVKLMQQGYPSRAPYSDLRGRFRTALPEFMDTLESHRFVELLLLACNCGPSDYQLGQDMVFFRSNKGGLLQELMMMRKDLVSKKIVDNGKAKGLDDDPDLGPAFKELDAFVAMRTKKRAEARALFEDAVMAAMNMNKWVKWGANESVRRSGAAEHMQAIRRGRVARIQAAQKRKALEEKRRAEEEARKAAEAAAAAAAAAADAEAAKQEEMKKAAEEAAAAAAKAQAEMKAAEDAQKAAELEAAETQKRIAEAKAKADAEAEAAAAAAAVADEEDEDDDLEDDADEKWFTRLKFSNSKEKSVHRYLMCKGVEWGFQYHNFYGDWELSTTDPLCNNRPHYVHNTMYGGHAHLFHTIDPHYHVPRWVIGPAPGNENGWAFCESDAATPHEVQATWISWDGFEWHSCKSFRYVPKEHEMDGLSDEEDFDDNDEDWADENQFGNLSSMSEDTSSKTKVPMTNEEYNMMLTNRQNLHEATLRPEDKGSIEPSEPTIAEDEEEAGAEAGADDSGDKKGKKGKKEKAKKDKKKK